jgi:hypothetical protein
MKSFRIWCAEAKQRVLNLEAESLDSDEEVDLEDESSDLGSDGLDLKDEIECVFDH